MAETNGLLNRRRGYTLPRVRISLSPPIFIMYYVYVLYSPSLNKRYVGSTSVLTNRISEHNSGKSKFTKGGIPWSLVYSESFPTLSLARKRELFLKSGQGRKFLDSLLSNSTASSEPEAHQP